MHSLDMDLALADFLKEGSFEATSSELGSDDAMDYDASPESGVNQYTSPSVAPARPLHEEFHALHRPNFAERTTKYLEKLYCMLEQCPETIATWIQGGSSFAVLDSEALEKTIIPRFFKPIKFESFIRQLNSYGFRKAKYTVQNQVVFAFRHTDFRRGHSHQLQTIKRRRRVKREEKNPGADCSNPSTPHDPTVPVTNVQVVLQDIMKLIQTLQSDLADTKALVHSLVGPASDQVVLL
ncbi:hypothetical protein LEN26_017607 [Aphanomyces euteiches]|nr:hypothetical protein LEN26_017607 [Aphanomyces euteiches]KAH9106006.1 hypothetical protein AeMF1_018301 [Aphanomyces euteiches]KAH9196964.1 hypothetical protein AeNC1_001043 [Aphanomyces euteiches]